MKLGNMNKQNRQKILKRERGVFLVFDLLRKEKEKMKKKIKKRKMQQKRKRKKLRDGSTLY